MDSSALLNIINSYDLMSNIIMDNMQYIIQQFITRRPYERSLWELYEPTNIEQFKTNIKIQQFVISDFKLGS
jgi:hypothetical protein